MMRIPTCVISFVLLFLFLPTRSFSESQHAIDKGSCEGSSLGFNSSVQTVEFQSFDQDGNGRKILAKVSWKRAKDGRSRVLVRVHEPPDLYGAGVLLIEKEDKADMFIYLPDLKKVKRVTTRMLSGSMFGSDFSYEDFMQLQGIAVSGRTERLDDESIEGFPVYVAAHYPAPDSGSSYERIVSYWDSELCVPLKTEMWETGEKLRKVLHVDREALFSTKGSPIPQKLVMKDLRDDTSTQLAINDIAVDVKIKRKLFSTAHLERP